MLLVGQQKSLSRNKGATGKNRPSASTDTFIRYLIDSLPNAYDSLLILGHKLPHFMADIFVIVVICFCELHKPQAVTSPAALFECRYVSSTRPSGIKQTAEQASHDSLLILEVLLEALVMAKSIRIDELFLVSVHKNVAQARWPNKILQPVLSSKSGCRVCSHLSITLLIQVATAELQLADFCFGQNSGKSSE